MCPSHIQKEHPKLNASNSEGRTNILWIGKYEEVDQVKLLLPSKIRAASDMTEVPICYLHDVPQPNCTKCTTQRNSPTLPCCVFKSICVTMRLNINMPKDITNLDIQSISFELNSELCPILSRKQLPNAVTSQTANMVEEDFVFVKTLNFCRDAENRDWLVCYELLPPPRLKSKDAELASGYDYKYELILQDRGVKFWPLSSVIGYAMIHECSHGMFYRKYLKPEEPHIVVRHRFFRSSLTSIRRLEQEKHSGITRVRSKKK